MYGYRIFFVCEITSGCRLEISTSGSQFSPSSMVANSRVLDPSSVLASIYLISTTIVEFMILLHAKKDISRAFLWVHGRIVFTSSCQSRAFNRKYLTYTFENPGDGHSRKHTRYQLPKKVNKTKKKKNQKKNKQNQNKLYVGLKSIDTLY